MSALPDTTPSCGTSLDVLSRWHDGDVADPVLDRHIQGCAECRASLYDLGSTGTAVAGMSGVPYAAARVTETTARQGRRDMADFVHELALACLALRGNGRASPDPAPAAEPRDFAAVAADIRSLDRRLRELGVRLELAELPPAEPSPAQALDAARGALSALGKLEGASERQRRALAAADATRASQQS